MTLSVRRETVRNRLTSEIPPQALDAERAVLGLALTDPTFWPTMLTSLRATDFFLTKHQHVYDAMNECRRLGRQVDQILVSDMMRRLGTWDPAESLGLLTGLAADAAIVTNLLGRDYLGLIKEAAQTRDLIRIGATLVTCGYDGTPASKLRATVSAELAGLSQRDVGTDSGPWAAAQTVTEFLAVADPETPWLEPRLLAAGAITELFSPRGLGKTHVAYAVGIKLARAGRRVLLLDRDNARGEVKRRLRAWGAHDVTGLKVMTRSQVPPLTDRAAWKRFPFAEWDLVIVDALDSTAEGVGEKDSAKPAQAIAPLLDIAHRTDGPAFLVLGNTIKSGEHSRGSGIVEDRADISFEVRDATGLIPNGTKDWWLELPPAGVGSWADRASRRKRRDTYRLAFVPSKFRIGEEPEPFAYEISLASTPWTLLDVTDEIVRAGKAQKEAVERERLARLDTAAAVLQAELEIQVETGTPLTTDAAVAFLCQSQKLKRREARDLLDGRAGDLWEGRQDPSKPGKPRLWYPLSAPPGRLAQMPVDIGVRGDQTAAAEILPFSKCEHFRTI